MGRGIKEKTSSGHPTVKIVLERCARTENALKELQNYHHHHHLDLCSVCGLNEELIDLQNYAWTPLQSQLFKKRVVEWTLEVSARGVGGRGGGGRGDDSLTTHDDDEYGWGCEGCMAQFEMLALVQRQIADLEKKAEEIVSQLKKTIGDRLGVISQPNLPGTETTTSLIFDENPSLFTPMITDVVASDDEDVHLDLKPVILEESLQVDDALPELPDDDDVDDGPGDDTVGGADLISEAMNHSDQGGTKGVDLNLEEEFLVDEVQNDNPVGGVDLISEQEEAMHHSDVGDTMEEDHPQKSRRSKAQATHVISAILQNKDDDDDDDEYWPTIESDTDSDEQNERELEPNIGKKRDDRNGGGMPSNPSTSVRKGGDKRTCEVCGKQVVNLSRHMEIHRSDGQAFSCEACHKTFSTERYLSDHRRNVHLKKFRYKCQMCGKGFCHARNLKNHLKTRISCTELLKKRKFICPICKDGLTTKAHLRDHVREVHNGMKRTKCPHPKCNYRTFDKTYLERHFEIHHPQDKKEISCTICNEKFSSVKETLAHIRSNHICEFCKKSFPNKADLDEHQRTNHTGDQPYVCTKCGTKFSWNKELEHHLGNITCNLDEDDGGGLEG